jgi:hypothetical protein
MEQLLPNNDTTKNLNLHIVHRSDFHTSARTNHH